MIGGLHCAMVLALSRRVETELFQYLPFCRFFIL